MRLPRVCLILLAASALGPAAAAADGAWQTYLRPFGFGQLIAEGDTLWCATDQAGLLRYSPSTRAFTSYLRQPGALASNQLSALALDRSRRLWVGTLDKGVSVLSADRSTWSLVNTLDGLPSESVTVLEAVGDTMWIGTTSGLALWNGSEVAGRMPDGVNPSKFASDFVTGIAVLGDSLWVGTAAGNYVSRLSRGLEDFVETDGGLASRNVQALVSDGRDVFTLAGGLVYRFDGPAGWTALPGIGSVLGLSESRGRIMASGSQGLFLWQPPGWVSLNSQLQVNPASAKATPFAMAMDENGRVFAAGRPASSPDHDQSAVGVYVQPDGGGTWDFAFPPGPAGNNCLNVELDGPRVYVTTSQEGIGRFDGSQWRCWFPGPRAIDSDTTFRFPLFPYAMLVDRAGSKWFGCWTAGPGPRGEVEVMADAGLVPNFTRYVWDSTQNAPHSFTRGSSLDSSGGRWFGMDSPDPIGFPPLGLEYYRPDGTYGGHFDSQSGGGKLTNNLVWAVTVDHSGRVWAGSDQEIVYFDDPPTGASNMRLLVTTNRKVHALVAHGDSLWALTSGEVRRFTLRGSDEGEYDIPAVPDGQSVRPIDVGPDGRLWVGTSNGMRLWFTASRRDTFVDYNTSNSPIAGDDIRTIRVDRRTGVVWIATTTGLSRFDPSYAAPTPRLPALVVRVYPNPARLTGLGLTLRLAGNAPSYGIKILDLGGRVVRNLSVIGNGRVIWDGRDGRGDLVKPGIYFVRAESAGRAGVARIAVVR